MERPHVRFGFRVCLCLLVGTLAAAVDDASGNDPALQATVDALKAQIAEKEQELEKERAPSGTMMSKLTAEEDRGNLVDGLRQVMQKLAELEKREDGPAPAPVKNEKVEAAVQAFENSMKKGDVDESSPIQQDELHACALMAARRYCAGAGGDSPTPANSAWILLTRLVSTEAPLSPGEASKTTLFKSMAVCVKKLGKAGLSDFELAGGFTAQSPYALADDMAQEAEHKKGAIAWQGEVFQLGFKKDRWSHLRRVIARYLSTASTHAPIGTVRPEDRHGAEL